MTPYYILCTSAPEADREFLRAQFGPYIVQINDPMALLERTETVWRGHPLASGCSVIVPVVYNKGASLEPTPGLIPPLPYSYSQKPDSFQREMEFRYVLTCTADFVKLKALATADEGQPGSLDNHLTLLLPDCSDICLLT
jgi:hypothetical protein